MQNKAGETALMYAIQNNKKECVILLLEESEIANAEGKTPIQIARDGNHLECATVI